jgi:hypothetical protein
MGRELQTLGGTHENETYYGALNRWMIASDDGNLSSVSGRCISDRRVGESRIGKRKTMSDGRNMNDDSRLTFDHAGKESVVQANGGEQVDLQYSLPVLVGEHLESACFCFCSADIIHQDVELTPLSLNAINDVLDTTSRSKIRLYEESRILAVSCLRSRGGGHRGTAQCKAAYNRFSYTLRATGH